MTTFDEHVAEASWLVMLEELPEAHDPEHVVRSLAAVLADDRRRHFTAPPPARCSMSNCILLPHPPTTACQVIHD